ncbi:MAG: hypothetical protein V7631_2037 [Massilia sp.]|jgi:hypothetical protein
MATDQQAQDQQTQSQQAAPAPPAGQKPEHEAKPDTVDGLANKKPEELTPEELRLMADTMPGEGPGD